MPRVEYAMVEWLSLQTRGVTICGLRRVYTTDGVWLHSHLFSNMLSISMSRLTSIVCLLLAFTGCTTHYTTYGQKATAERSATLTVNSATQLTVEAGAGHLRIEARDTATDVEIEGMARAARERDLNAIQIRTDRDGDRLTVRTEIPRGNNQLDLVVVLPKGLSLTVNDGSGDASIDGVSGAFIRVKDGSGILELRSLNGALTVDDGSGNVTMNGVNGALDVTDGSGDLMVDGVNGDVTVSDDGSGTLRLSGVNGSVRIVDDGSGDIRVSGVTGDLHIEDDGSGDIDVDGISGDFTVEEDGSGDIRYAGVAGRVDIPDDD